ncbi:MAG: hypothetical protein JST00_18210 [Deltaproteobacteria bacterium]|nr:hypothetical protein [Deltaproteobacteria bacterium]
MQPLRSASALGIVALFAVGCSLLLDTAEATQCATQRDCDSNPSLRNRVCVEGFCVAPERETGTTNPDGGEGCESTEKCTLANSNQLSVCPQKGGPCIVWQTEQCRSPINDAAKDPNAIMIGSILPLTIAQPGGKPVLNAYSDRVRRSIDLAVEEFLKELQGGIVFPNGKVRPIAVVHCDSGLTSTGAKLALQHLTQVVGAQALIVDSDEDIAAIANEPALQGKPVACADCLGELPSGTLSWRIVPRLELEAPMVAWRVARLEEQIKALPSPPTDIKVGVLLSQERATAPFFAKLQQLLRFNGNKTTVQNGGLFRIFAPPDPRVQSVPHQQYIDEIAGFAPDILIVAMGGDFTTYYLPGVEAKWTAARRPHYVTTDLNFVLEPLSRVIGKNDDLRKRVSGTRPGFAAELQNNIQTYDTAYRLRWDFKDPDGAYSGYDATYALGMAILSTRLQPVIGGAQINAGFERLLSGQTVEFRPTDIPVAAIALGQTNATIDVRGLWSNLAWNITTHDFDADVSMYCLKRDETGSLIFEPNAGPHLTTATGVVDGVYTCD